MFCERGSASRTNSGDFMGLSRLLPQPSAMKYQTGESINELCLLLWFGELAGLGGFDAHELGEALVLR